MKNKIELLAPVGDFERGVIALNYGADAIYLGGQKFSLRSRASNFDFNEIKKIVNYAHQINKKIYFVINILCNNELITQFKAYIKQLEKLKIDGYICADPFIISYLSVNYPNKDVHISTQQSISNSKAALFFKRNKATRIVCAREISFSNLKLLKENIGNQLELEYFVHGALCISYSGQCMLSNYFCLRNANIGRCAQSCRWNYLLNDNKKVLNKNLSISPRDLNLIKHIGKLKQLGINSIKIEGRMKSEHYVATVVNSYRKALDSNKSTNVWSNDLLKCANREVSTGWFLNKPNKSQMLKNNQKKVSQIYVLLVIKKIAKYKYLAISKNHFTTKQNFEVLSPNLNKIKKIKIKNVWDKNNELKSIVNTPMSKLTIEINKDLNLKENDIIRISD